MLAEKLGKHRTMDSETERSLAWLGQRPEVSKITLCPRRAQSHRRPAGSVTIKERTATGLKVTVYGGAGLREVHLQSADPSALARLIEDRWPDQQRSNDRIRRSMGQMADALTRAFTPSPEADVTLADLPPAPVAAPAAAAPVTPAPAPPVPSAPVPAAPPAATLSDVREIGARVSTGVEYALVEVTPEIAFNLLAERNRVNRPIKKHFVKKLVHLLKAGGWNPEAGVVMFDRDGYLINGQHRLTAIFESDMTVYVTMGYGFSPETRGDLDTLQTTRTDVDIARMIHGDRAASALHFATAVRIWFRGRRRDVDDVELTPRERQQVLALHRNAIDTVTSFGRGRGIRIPAAAFAAMARASYTADAARLADFGKVLHSGMVDSTNADAHTGSTLLLRNVIGLTKHGRDEVLDRQLYQKSERALKAFLDGERLTRLYIIEEELFPVPPGTEAA